MCFALLGTPLVAQSPASISVVKAGRLLDPRTGNVLSPAAVLIENGKIKEVGPPARVEAEAPAGARVIDLGSATLLPGLIDSHTHLLLNVVVPAEAEQTRYSFFQPALLLAVAAKSPAERVLLAPSWRAKIWRAGSPRCAIWGTPASTAMRPCETR